MVSKGRQPIEVQDFTGKPADQAVATLTDAGLQVDATKQEFSTDVPKGSVISQSPASGTLFRGETVVLVVSKGPEMVKVPNVQGKQLGEARTILVGAGFQVKVESFMGGIFGISGIGMPIPLSILVSRVSVVISMVNPPTSELATLYVDLLLLK